MIKTLILVPANGKGAINRPQQAYDSLFFLCFNKNRGAFRLFPNLIIYTIHITMSGKFKEIRSKSNNVQ